MNIIFAIIVISLIIFYCIKKRNNIYKLFYTSCLTLEFYYIHFMGGILRVYNLFSAYVVLRFIKDVPSLFQSKIFISVLLFLLVNFFTSLFANNITAAIISLLSIISNFIISIAIALMMFNKKISQNKFISLTLNISIVCVIWGLIQILFHNIGIDLYLSEEQKVHVIHGLGASFKTEPDTFGKFMNMPFLLAFLLYLNGYSKNKKYLLIFSIGILMNFIRTPLYGLMISLLFLTIWYLKKGKGRKIIKIASIITILCTTFLVLVEMNLLPIGEYAKYKIDVLFKLKAEDLLNDGSAVYRLDSMNQLIEQTLSSTKKSLVGQGWNQAEGILQGEVVKLGGGDFINVFGASGIIGAGSYIIMLVTIILVLVSIIKKEKENENIIFSEWILFTYIAFLVTSQVSGMFYAPEYYIIIGLAIYKEVEIKNKRIRICRGK